MSEKEANQLNWKLAPNGLSVVIPIYNEISTINEILNRVEGTGLAREIIMVDDGSTDGTRDALRELEAQNRKGVVILYHESNSVVVKSKPKGIRVKITHFYHR